MAEVKAYTCPGLVETSKVDSTLRLWINIHDYIAIDYHKVYRFDNICNQ